MKANFWQSAWEISKGSGSESFEGWISFFPHTLVDREPIPLLLGSAVGSAIVPMAPGHSFRDDAAHPSSPRQQGLGKA
jgi:hypothetical protein